jgi:hypothetical protein
MQFYTGRLALHLHGGCIHGKNLPPDSNASLWNHTHEESL